MTPTSEGDVDHGRDSVLLDVAQGAARRAGRHLLDSFRTGVEIELKGRNDLVSALDRDSEALIIDALQNQLGEVRVIGEEGGVVGPESDEEWVIDPLDGTANYLHGHPCWSVSIACLRRGRPSVGVVYEPLADNLFSAVLGRGADWNGDPISVGRPESMDEAFLATGFPFRAHPALDVYLKIFRRVFLGVRGIRRCGSAALDLAHVAAGIYDGFFEFRLSMWDIAAGIVLIEEAGGVVSDLDGGHQMLRSGNIVAGAPSVHAELRAWVAEEASEELLAQLCPLAG